VLSVAPFLAIGGALFDLSEPILRLMMVVLALLLTLIILIRFTGYQYLEAIVLTVLVLLVLNGAFRSLFPLLLNPHNLFSARSG
jgi:cytochrome bd-type quinol oxidase subunit 2